MFTTTHIPVRHIVIAQLRHATESAMLQLEAQQPTATSSDVGAVYMENFIRREVYSIALSKLHEIMELIQDEPTKIDKEIRVKIQSLTQAVATLPQILGSKHETATNKALGKIYASV